jgi:hypothetical protein
MNGKQGTYHVIPIGDRGEWRLVEEGTLCWLHAFKSREDAVSFAHQLAQSWEIDRLVVHAQGGEAEAVWIFAEDPDRTCLMNA